MSSTHSHGGALAITPRRRRQVVRRAQYTLSACCHRKCVSSPSGPPRYTWYKHQRYDSDRYLVHAFTDGGGAPSAGPLVLADPLAVLIEKLAVLRVDLLLGQRLGVGVLCLQPGVVNDLPPPATATCHTASAMAAAPRGGDRMPWPYRQNYSPLTSSMEPRACALGNPAIRLHLYMCMYVCGCCKCVHVSVCHVRRTCPSRRTSCWPPSASSGSTAGRCPSRRWGSTWKGPGVMVQRPVV